MVNSLLIILSLMIFVGYVGSGHRKKLEKYLHFADCLSSALRRKCI